MNTKLYHLAGIAGALIASVGMAAAQQKISDRVSLPGANVDPANDLFGIVDISAGASGSKKITINDTFAGWGMTPAGANLAKSMSPAGQRFVLGLGDASTLNLATQAEAEGGISSSVLMTPQRVAQAIAALGSSGGLVLATQAEAEAGLENTHYMSALRTAQAISARASMKFSDSLELSGLLSDETGDGVAVFNNQPDLYSVNILGGDLDSVQLLGPLITLGDDATGDIYYRSTEGNLARLGAGTNGQFLRVNAGIPQWATIAGGGDLLAVNNLSDLVNVATARSNLGLTLGSQVQVWDADLDVWATKAAPTGEVVGTTTLQTLSGKTLSAPVINIGSDAAGDLYYRDAGGAFVRLGIGSTGQVLTVASGLPSWAAASGGGGGGLVNITEALSTGSPNSTINVASLSVTGGSTNADLVLSPKGTGSILAQIPDGTTTGGNKRGTRTVDLQMNRSLASQVASGAGSVISGGRNNSTGGDYSAIGGGSGNWTVSAYATVAGGDGNSATSYATASGRSNTASGANSVAMGYTSTASGDSSVALGYNATASGVGSFAFGYANAIASGSTSICLASQSQANGQLSFVTGEWADARSLYGAEVRAVGRFGVRGDAQGGRYLLRRATTNATQSELSGDGGFPAAATRIVLPNNSTYSFTGKVAARSSTGDAAAWRVSGTIERGANAAATAIIGSVTMTDTQAEAGAASWALAVDADTTNGSLRFQVTGAASTNIRWVAQVETVEVVY